jgi:acyl-CoA thioesterase
MTQDSTQDAHPSVHTPAEPDAPATFEQLRENLYRSGFFRLLDLRVDSAHDGRGVVRITVDARLMHPQQIVHGGVIFTLADTAMSMSLLSVLPANTRFSTIEAKINYIAPVVTGELLAEATIIHRGRSTAVMEASVYNLKGDEKVLTARVLGTFHISASRYA